MLSLTKTELSKKNRRTLFPLRYLKRKAYQIAGNKGVAG